MAEENQDEDVVLEPMGDDENNLNDPEWIAKVSARVDPILTHLEAGEAAINKGKIKDQFIKIWDLEKGEKLEPEEQFLTTVGLFMYCAHMELDEYSIKVDEARNFITGALRDWLKPETEKMVSEEKSKEDPFRAFVEGQQVKIDKTYTWRHFLLDHKKVSALEWTYKMKKCWFAQFFIRYGRTDLTLTACQFDQIPAEARKDYVKLKLSNQFPKWGTSCTFQYTPPSV